MLVGPGEHVAIAATCLKGPGHPSTLREIFPLIRSTEEVLIDLERSSSGPGYKSQFCEGTLARGDGEPYLPAAFFNTHADASVPGVLPGQRWKAAIAGVALRWRVVEPRAIDIPAPDWAKAIDLPMPDGRLKLDASQMSVWLPSDRFIDVVQFGGEIVEQRFIGASLFGQPAWRTIVAVSREAPDMFLPFIVTAHVLVGEKTPAVGDQIEGLAWLQGRMVEKIGDLWRLRQ